MHSAPRCHHDKFRLHPYTRGVPALSHRRTRALALVTAMVVFAGVLTDSAAAVLRPGQSSAHLLGPGDHHLSLAWGGLTRTLILHVPSGQPRAGRPLILVFHGGGDTAATTIAKTNFEQVSNVTGDLVAFMQGYENYFNEQTSPNPAAMAHINDVGYTAATLNLLRSLTKYDPARVALSGFSNGAMMVETLGCRLAGRIRLIVPVEGELNTPISPTCHPARPISVYEIHATADTSIPYDGGPFAGTGGTVYVLSAPASAARWAALDGCRAGPRRTRGAGVIFSTYGSCRAGVTVTLRTILGGSHVWGASIGNIVAAALAR